LFLLQGGSIADQYLILLTTLVSALGCNVCITGLNQVIDVELDKINKPELPIASGELSISTAKKIVVISGIIAVGAAALLHWVLLLLIM
jgi:homogentisate phytyltransferase/homogentisate geranylgeranyltransferase